MEKSLDLWNRIKPSKEVVRGNVLLNIAKVFLTIELF